MDVTYEEFKKQFETELMDQCAFLDEDGDYIRESDDIPGYLKDEFHRYIENGIVDEIPSFFDNLETKGMKRNEIFNLLGKPGDIDFKKFDPLMKKILIKFLLIVSKDALIETSKFLDIQSIMHNLQPRAEVFAAEFYKNESFDEASDKAFERYFK